MRIQKYHGHDHDPIDTDDDPFYVLFCSACRLFMRKEKEGITMVMMMVVVMMTMMVLQRQPIPPDVHPLSSPFPFLVPIRIRRPRVLQCISSPADRLAARSASALLVLYSCPIRSMSSFVNRNTASLRHCLQWLFPGGLLGDALHSHQQENEHHSSGCPASAEHRSPRPTSGDGRGHHKRDFDGGLPCCIVP